MLLSAFGTELSILDTGAARSCVRFIKLAKAVSALYGIVAVSNGGPADRAGLHAGDVISAVAGTDTPDTTALAEVLASKEPGQVVSVTVTRGGAEHTVKLTLGELPGA